MAGTSNRVVYSWDTNVFLAHLKQEAGKPLEDIGAVADEIERGIADCVISVIVVAEMLDAIDDPQLATDFQEFMKRPNVELVNVYPKLARKTAELRKQWQYTASSTHEARQPNNCPSCGKSLGENRNIKTPDAIVLMTAMLHGATVLHSFEPGMKRHSKTTLVDGLEICDAKLYSGQLILPERNDDKPRAETTNEPAEKTPAPAGESEHVTVDAGESSVSGDEHATTEATGSGEEQIANT